jgi:hypothetical protein
MKSEKLDSKNFTPDDTFEPEYPWEDVLACFGETLPQDDFKFHNSCPKCGLNSEKLCWIDFRSPRWTWKNLCGVQGPLSICPECKIQVELIIKVRN